MHIGHGVGILALIAAIGFAFGERAAKLAVGTVLIAGFLGFLYIAVLIVTGAI